MSLKIKKKKAEASVKPGTYLAICVVVADLGEQYNAKFDKYSSKLQLAFEIPSERITVDGEDKPCWVMQDYTASLNKKAGLRTLITSWLGRELTADEEECFDVSQLLGKPCMLSVTVAETDSGTYSNIAAVIGLPAGMEAPKPESDLILFDWDGFDEEKFNALPPWLQTKIKKSSEYQKRYAIDEKLDFDNEEERQPEF
jgi:hypothetical protein